jgi:hypothetical protein
MKTIRTTVYSLTILLALFISPLHAAYGKPMKKNNLSGPDFGIDLAKYAFCVPTVADFNDSDPGTATLSTNLLKPTAPAEATFEDAEDVYKMETPANVLRSLAPVAPKEAEFGDLYDAVPQLIRDLAPVTPVTANFEDND